MLHSLQYKISTVFSFQFLVLFSLIITSGCKKFVTIDPPKSDIESEVVYSNDVTATSAVLGIYSELLQSEGFIGGSNYSVLALTGLSSDELVNYPEDPLFTEFEQNAINPNNYYIFSLWSNIYGVIYQVNAIIEGISNSTGITPPVRDHLMGEALFARALCYFHLVNLFGDVPLVLTTDYKANSVVSRVNADLVYDQILLDLKEARELLVVPYLSNGERTRPNKFTASALLSRVYLYKEDWANAEAISSEIITDEQLYSLPDSVSDVFLANSVESIWQLRPKLNGSGTAEGNIFSSYGNNVLNFNVLRPGVFELFDAEDHRLRHWIECIIIEPDTIYFPRKYKQDGFGPVSTEYSSVFRLAEQYLIRAEARARQNNILGDNSAESDINKIRSRVGLSATSATSQSEILDDILDQRRLEFIAEGGHRWFDLKRLGKAKDILMAEKGDFEITDQLYPIPANEISANPSIGKQNDGY